MTYGYAIKQNGKLLIRTASDTKRAAIVNWLLTEARILTLAGSSDEEIQADWLQHSPKQRAEICFVELNEVKGPPAVALESPQS